ncbi:MAG: ABC transporter ATP-binding protein [Gammaproteobacteria bacterium]
MALVTDAVEVRYGARCAVHATSLTLGPSGFIALVGPNGAGKSSLLKALAGLASHTGTITWQGRALAALAARDRARAIAYLAQASTVHWPLSARDVVTLGRLAHGRYGVAPTAGDREAVEWALAQTATMGFAERSVAALSIGERARVLLARALAVRAPVLLVDEPIAMLDPYHQLEIMGVLARYARGATGGAPALVVAVLHDLTLAARFCGRVLLMNDGRVVEDGTPAAALSAENVRRYYHVEPFVTQHEGEPVIVPWRSPGVDAAQAQS